jgi:hypothetical protein
MSTLSQRIKHRRDTSANWTAGNPVLAAGELGIEIDAASLRGKYGDGIAAWNSLPYTELGRRPEFEAIQFDLDAAVDPVVDGQLSWNVDEGTLQLGKGGISNYIGQETMVLCRNASNTVTIPKATAVMFAGSVGASGRLRVAPMVSDGTFPGYVFFGVTDQPILGGEDGYVSVFGKIRGVNTSAYVDGDILWCDPAVPGGFTKIEPHAPNLKLAVAAVISAGNNGTIFVRWTTGSRLEDLHDVEANGAKQDGDFLAWNGIAERWEPKEVPIPDLGPMLETPQVIAEDYTIKVSFNGLSVGPVEIAPTYTVTVPFGATWAVV